ncbi:MAG: molybdopterin-dependent oxidoreductase, partial [Cocleimonas sp.]
GVLASARATIEEQYLLQKLMRSIGVNNIDHRLRQTDFYEQENADLFPSLGMDIADIENLNAVMLIGSNVRKEQPMINHRIRKAALKGAQIYCVNPRELEFNYDMTTQLVVAPNEIVASLILIAKSSYTLSKNKIPAGLSDLLKGKRANKDSKAFAESLSKAENAAVFVGNIAEQHPSYSTIRALGLVIAQNTGAKFGFIGGAANTSGAWLAGLLPHRKEAGEIVEQVGMTSAEMLNHPKKIYMLLDVELESDSDNPQQALAALNQAECVIAISPYANKKTLANADIILPSAAYSETSGTFVNIEGNWQSFKAASKAYENARPAWKILRVLGNQLNVEGFDYVSSKDVRDELKMLCDEAGDAGHKFEANGIYTTQDKVSSNSLQRIGEVAEYGCDSLVRRAQALQDSKPEQHQVHLNTKEIENLGLQDVLSNTDQKVQVKQGGVMVEMPMTANDMIPEGCALLMAGTKSSCLLGSAFGEIEVTL